MANTPDPIVDAVHVTRLLREIFPLRFTGEVEYAQTDDKF